MPESVLIQSNEATSRGAINAGSQYFSSHPTIPQNEASQNAILIITGTK